MPRAEPLQLKAAACQTFAVYQENHGDPLHVQVIIFIIKCDRHIYTHRESIVRNHEPYAKALGNYIYIIGERAKRASLSLIM